MLPIKLVANTAALDAYAQNTMGIPLTVLMENAGRQVAEAVLWKTGLGSQSAHVLLMAGNGNNGGDAFVAARHLAGGALQVTVMVSKGAAELAPSSADSLWHQQLSWLQHYPITVRLLEENALWRHWLDEADIVVDGVLGTGLSRPIEGLWADVIAYANRTRSNRHAHVAIDISSGVMAATGHVPTVAFSADETITFEVAKPGHYLEAGKAHSGRITVTPIALPPALVAQAPSKVSLLSPQSVLNSVPELNPTGHKYTRGLVGVVCSPANMPGAPQLVAHAAMRSGAGMVAVLAPSHWHQQLPAAEALPLETVPVSVPDSVDWHEVLTQKPYQSLVLGPGWGTDPEAMALLEAMVPVVATLSLPLVLDADALNLLALARQQGRPLRVPAHTVITPHVGEAARLLNTTSDSIREDMVAHAQLLQQLMGVAAVVLKSSSVVVATSEGMCGIPHAGNAGLATAGSGDVLAGILAGLLAQGYAPDLAAAAAACWHATTGDMLAETETSVGITALGLAQALPKGLARLRQPSA